MAVPVETGRWPDRISGEWTVEALETLPDNGLRYEILDGTLLVTPSPTPRQQGAILELAVLLREVCPPDHMFVAPLDWQPDGLTSLEPDLMVVRRVRIGEKRITEPPSLVVEVLSPGTARIDRMIKRVRLCWRDISGWRPGRGGWPMGAGVYALCISDRLRVKACRSSLRPFPWPAVMRLLVC